MARARSSLKRSAILASAVHEIAENGLGASTANIARRAGVAAGTLFTYFANKEELLNELYFELKAEVYTSKHGLSTQSQSGATSETCVVELLQWAIEFPEKRKVSIQLNVSDFITAATRTRTAGMRGAVEETLLDLGRRSALRGLPDAFAAAFLSSMQEATMDFVAKQPKQRDQLIDRAFYVFWRAVR